MKRKRKSWELGVGIEGEGGWCGRLQVQGGICRSGKVGELRKRSFGEYYGESH
ncbi:uncharacterized protein G2W53_021325 [Senna tora]|uniref:Uncharacterized protein n=1 Tax=Senna tora TaxID=362788 RepID=A0A834TLQ4_9FABA|nr:uncharacterized protein G2W53_021325 [Senna tora]